MDPLAEFHGSPVIVVFHPPHWDPARAEHVEMYNRLIATLPGLAGTRLLSIGDAGPWRALEFDGETIALPVVMDSAGALARRFGVADGPAVVVLDAEGAVRWRRVGARGDALPDAVEIARALSVVARPLVESPPPWAPEPLDARSPAWTRREFVATVLGAAFAIALVPIEARAAALTGTATPPHVSTRMNVTLNVNGRDLALALEPRVTLLDALREYAGLTGTKKGCDHGQCGACTVHVDGRRELACLTFAVMQDGKRITTVEGLAPADGLHPVQQAFIEHDGFQCGYCTPGQIMSASAMLHEPWGPGDDDVREAMSGNICRCGAYPGIVAAIQAVRRGGASAGSDT